MGEATLADFVGKFDAEVSGWDDPKEGRVILGEHQLVLAAEKDDKVSIPLSSVFDINFDANPQIFDPLPGTPLTVAYEHDGGRSVAVIASEEATALKFHTVLFKTILNGTGVVIKHPARRGGRVTNMLFHSGTLSLSQGGVRLTSDNATVQIEPSAVTAFDRETRDVSGKNRPIFVVRHMQDGTALTTLVATNSNRTLSLLGRYLRRHYDELMSSLAGINLTEVEIETLVTIYSTGGGSVGVLAGVVDAGPRGIKKLLQSLHDDALVRPTDGGAELTTRGQVVVNHYMDRVNQ
jgi:helix-turn-helix protein